VFNRYYQYVDRAGFIYGTRLIGRDMFNRPQELVDINGFINDVDTIDVAAFNRHHKFVNGALLIVISSLLIMLCLLAVLD
jgi:hypothetical protein